jgi:hypothetical protein
MKNIFRIAPQELIISEVTSDLSLMFDQRRKMKNINYKKLTDKEFAENRKKHTQANITGWFGWENNYGDIIIARIAQKTGYKTTSSNIGSFINKDDRDKINNIIEKTITFFLNEVI